MKPLHSQPFSAGSAVMPSGHGTTGHPTPVVAGGLDFSYTVCLSGHPARTCWIPAELCSHTSTELVRDASSHQLQ